MGKLINFFFLSIVLTVISPLEASERLGKNLSIENISNILQDNLNKKKTKPFNDFFLDKDSSDLALAYKEFIKKFPDAKWSIKSLNILNDGSHLLEIKIHGTRQEDDHLYKMQSVQKIGLNLIGEKIVKKEIISSYSILRSGETYLPVSLIIPDSVLTGTQYELNIIFNEPIEKGMLAGGIANLTTKDILNNKSPRIELSPLSSGGIFKLVQAPLNPGKQHWAAIIAHPEGIISITKSVNISSEDIQIMSEI
tara:strand:+ start:1592 stop:2347 length:756 start_codon:yes stop_codon:yes gene_type:complete